MKREPIDFFLVPDNQLDMHARLLNWAMWVSVSGGRFSAQSPMWRQGKSNGRQWHVPELRAEPDQSDGIKIERAVGLLPSPHAEALRWWYVRRYGPSKARRLLGTTSEGLFMLVKDGRTMLINRGA